MLRVTYEIEAMRDGRWWVIGQMTTLAQAEEDARALLQRADVGGVRVVREVVDLVTERTAALTVFRSEKAPRSRKRPSLLVRAAAPLAATAAAISAELSEPTAPAVIPVRPGSPAAAHQSGRWVPWAAGIVGLLALASLAALLG